MKEKMFVLALAGVLSLPLAVAAPADAGPLHAAPTLQAQDQTGGTQAEPTKAQRYYQRGVEYMNNSRFLDAVEQFQLALDENADYIDAYRRLAYAYTQMGATESEYYQDALDTYEDLEAKLPADDVDVRKNIAFVQAAMGDLDDAIATYKEILDITPEDCSIWTQIGDAQKVQADRMKANGGSAPDKAAYDAKIKAAIDAYTKVTDLCPDSLAAYNTLGELLFNTGDMDGAAGIYTKVLAKDPSKLDIASRLGYIYMQGKEYAKAIPIYEKLLDLDPSRVNDRKQYALALQKAGKTSEAGAQFQKIIDADPAANASLYCNLCMMYVDAEDGEKTIDTAMKGIAAAAPVEGCLTYGWAKGLEFRARGMMKTGQYDRAISTFREAKLKFKTITSDPNFGKAATQQLDRMDQFIKIAEQTKEKAKQQSGP